jgi:serine/threonine-protein kinase
MSPRVGLTLSARYRLQRLIATGGMGQVWEAVDSRLGRHVAVKILKQEYSSDPEFIERFRAEARTVAMLNHPGIASVYDYGETLVDDESRTAYLVMELVNGEPLNSVLKRDGELSVQRALDMLEQTGRALHVAHTAGLVHRDVKPGNIMITPTGQVKLTDFGIAKAVDAAPVTQTGMVMGTAQYIAPEQALGHDATAASDVYSLGVVGYEAVSGSRPFTGDGALTVAMKHIKDSPPPLPTHLPANVRELIEITLAKNPNMRYPNGGAFADAVAIVRSGGRPPRPNEAPTIGRASATAVSTDVSAPPPALPDGGGNGRRLAIVGEFQYVHGPSWLVDDGMPVLGHRDLVDELATRIAHSRGGAFLVTGFRGVGKTSLVRQAILQVSRAVGHSTRIVPIHITLARPVSPAELLFVVVRQLYEQLDLDGTMQRLPQQAQDLIRTAFIRTSLAVKETRGRTIDRGMTIGLSAAAGVLPGGITPKADLTRKRSQTQSTESAYLTYSTVDAEYDLLRILQVLSEESARPSRVRRRPWKRLPAQRIHPIVVLDEVDKLTELNTEATNGMQELEQLIGTMKSVFTSQNVHFIVVAGVDLQDQVIRDTSRGIGVYESVFAWQLYVPCLWEASTTLLDTIVSPQSSDNPDLAALAGFLSYRARGVPRRLWQEINRLVQWDADRPLLEVGADGDRVTFYFRLQKMLSDFFCDPKHPALFPIPLDNDRMVLSSYYAMDRILRTNGRSFTADDLVSSEEEPDFDPVLQVSVGLAGRLLEYLTSRNVLSVVRSSGNPSSTIIEDLQEQATVYRLVDDVRAVVAGFAREHQDERMEPLAQPAAAHVGDFSTTMGRAPLAYSAREPEPAVVAGLSRPRVDAIEVISGRYFLRQLISSGGVGSVYQAQDIVLGRDVAVKVLDPWALRDPNAKARFVRERQIASVLAHPNIVQTYEIVDLDEERTAIVMELVPGPSLAEVISRDGVPVGQAISIAVDLLSALAACAREGVSRIDLKPSKIVMRNGRTAVVIDLGMAKRTKVDDSVTQIGALVGTPAYMAPEQLERESVDIRADIYCVGLIIIECITGVPPRSAGSVPELRSQVPNEEFEIESVDASAELRAVIARATARMPADRFQTPEEFHAALLATPEGELEMAVTRPGMSIAG